MKTMILLATTFILSSVANARITYEHSVNGALAKVKFRVVDQDGGAVSGAKIWGGFSANFSKDSILVDGLTDTNGEYIAQGKCNELLRVDVTKAGYYHTEEKVNFWQSKAAPIIVDGKWQPYGEKRTVVLKRIQQPHDMLGSDRPPQRKIKIYDEWLGFDLEKGDFLPPVGNGCESDMLVRFHLSGDMPYDWSIRMDVSFTNFPFAGAYRLKKDDWSDMKCVYQADTNEVYLSEMSFRYAREKGNRHPVVEKLEKDEYLVFRTRTKIDREGRLLSARYGKLYGPWHFEDAGGSQIQKVFLNKNDNDANLEDVWTIENAEKYRRD